jgi:hypothetical protein
MRNRFPGYSRCITLKNKVFRSFLVILVHEQKKKRLLCNFDPTTTPRARNEVQKNKQTPHYQTEFDGESEKNTTVLCIIHLQELLFLTKYRS